MTSPVVAGKVDRYTVREGEAIEPPIIVASGPRTGTTAAGFLLGCDPDNRSLLSWEARRPCPPPERETAACDPRAVASVGDAYRGALFLRSLTVTGGAAVTTLEDTVLLRGGVLSVTADSQLDASVVQLEE